MEDILNKLAEALLLALAFPLFAPVLRLVDRSRRRQEAVRRLEHLQLLADLDDRFLGADPDRAAAYEARYKDVVLQSADLREIWPYTATTEPADLHFVEADDAQSGFTIFDVIFAAFLPGLFLAQTLIDPSSVEDGDRAMFIATSVFGMLISIAVARFYVCKRVKSGLWQGFWQLFASLPSLFAGAVVAGIVTAALGL